MERLFRKTPFIDWVLKGISQIMLQENRWTGLLFIIGMFVGSWRYAIAAVLATTVGTAVAYLLKFDEIRIQRGLYGFNPALIGVAFFFVFEDSALLWSLICVGAILTVLMDRFFTIKRKRMFTFPYIVVTWITVFILQQFTSIPTSSIVQTTFDYANTEYGSFLAIIGGFGEVIFQEHVLASFIIFLAVYISSPVAALYGVIASLLGTLFSQMVNQSIHEVHMGLFSFNAVLTAVVFSGNKRIDGLWVLIGSLLTIFINITLVEFRVLALFGGVFTFPFVMGTWITLWIQKKFQRIRLRFKYW